MKLTRRDFTKALSLVGVSQVITPWLTPFFETAWAQGGRKNFLLVHMTGGADCIVGLDPWRPEGSWGLRRRPDENQVFLGYADSKILLSSDQKIALGPSAQPLAPFFSEIAVLNGVHTRRIDHGNVSATGGSNEVENNILPSQIAGYQAGSGIALIVSSSVVPTEPNVFTKSLLGDDDNSSLIAHINANAYAIGASEQFGALKMRKVLEALNRVRLPVEANVPNRIADVFELGLSNMIYHETRSDLDTHSDDESKNQISRQREAWQQVADILSTLKQRNLLSSTIVMVTTEFSRQAARSSQGGKEHNGNTNSVLLAGGGIKGGITVGGSHINNGTFHNANVFDFNTFQTVTSYRQAIQLGATEPIRPQDIKATIFSLFGMKASDGNIIKTLLKA
jgi:hypothetical protein